MKLAGNRGEFLRSCLVSFSVLLPGERPLSVKELAAQQFFMSNCTGQRARWPTLPRTWLFIIKLSIALFIGMDVLSRTLMQILNSLRAWRGIHRLPAAWVVENVVLLTAKRREFKSIAQVICLQPHCDSRAVLSDLPSLYSEANLTEAASCTLSTFLPAVWSPAFSPPVSLPLSDVFSLFSASHDAAESEADN